MERSGEKTLFLLSERPLIIHTAVVENKYPYLPSTKALIYNFGAILRGFESFGATKRPGENQAITLPSEWSLRPML